MPGEAGVPSRTRNPITERMREMRGLAGAGTSRPAPGRAREGRPSGPGAVGRAGRSRSHEPSPDPGRLPGPALLPRGSARGSPRPHQWPWARGAAWQQRECRPAEPRGL